MAAANASSGPKYQNQKKKRVPHVSPGSQGAAWRVFVLWRGNESQKKKNRCPPRKAAKKAVNDPSCLCTHDVYFVPHNPRFWNLDALAARHPICFSR